MVYRYTFSAQLTCSYLSFILDLSTVYAEKPLTQVWRYFKPELADPVGGMDSALTQAGLPILCSQGAG